MDGTGWSGSDRGGPARRARSRSGMVFQEGALFDSLTVGENVGYRLAEDGELPWTEIEERVREMLGFVGLEPFYDRMPSRAARAASAAGVAVARALVAAPADHALRRAHHRPRSHHGHHHHRPDRRRCATWTASASILVTHQLRDALQRRAHVRCAARAARWRSTAARTTCAALHGTDVPDAARGSRALRGLAARAARARPTRTCASSCRDAARA